MNIISLKCPECGASLSIEEGRTQCFCQYCGTKIMLDDERSYTKTIHTIDDAKIREIEANREIRLREMEMEEKKEKRNRLGLVVKIIFSVILVGLTMFGMENDSIIGLFSLCSLMWMWLIHFISKNNKNN